MRVAYSPGQDAPAGIQGQQTVTCCCTAAETCETQQCGTVVAAQQGTAPLTLSYSTPVVLHAGRRRLLSVCLRHRRRRPRDPQAEVLSAALFAGAARGDVLPLPDAAVVAGKVRVRVATELREIDVLTGAGLLAIDHEPGVVLATDSDGHLAAVAQPVTAVVGRVARDA